MRYTVRYYKNEKLLKAIAAADQPMIRQCQQTTISLGGNRFEIYDDRMTTYKRQQLNPSGVWTTQTCKKSWSSRS